MEGKSIVARESGLYKDLTRGQIIMISLGGAIGTSLFLSSGMAVGYAGLRFWSAMPLPPFSLARAEAIHYVALIPLASGLLSGKYQRGQEPQSGRLNDARVMCEHLLTPSSFDAIETLRQCAADRGRSVPAVYSGSARRRSHHRTTFDCSTRRLWHRRLRRRYQTW